MAFKITPFFSVILSAQLIAKYPPKTLRKKKWLGIHSLKKICCHTSGRGALHHTMTLPLHCVYCFVICTLGFLSAHTAIAVNGAMIGARASPSRGGNGKLFTATVPRFTLWAGTVEKLVIIARLQNSTNDAIHWPNVLLQPVYEIEPSCFTCFPNANDTERSQERCSRVGVSSNRKD